MSEVLMMQMDNLVHYLWLSPSPPPPPPPPTSICRQLLLTGLMIFPFFAALLLFCFHGSMCYCEHKRNSKLRGWSGNEAEVGCCKWIYSILCGWVPSPSPYVSCPPHLIPDGLSLFSLLFHFHMYYCEHKLKSK